MSGERRWSKPRRSALEAFFINNGRARRSNTTDSARAHAYWQSVDWLDAEGLIERAGFDDYVLTDAGWTAGAQLWNVPPATVARMKTKAGAATGGV